MDWKWWKRRTERWEAHRELYARMADVVLVLDLEGKIVRVVRSHSTRHPVSEEMEGKYLRELLGPEQGLKGAQAMREALASGKRTNYDYTVLREGNTYYFGAQIIPLGENEGGKEDRVLWLAYDKTDSKVNEGSLWMRNELLEGVLNARISLMGEGHAGSSSALEETLKIVGNATKADRVYILEHYQTPYYQVLSLQREWCAGHIASQLGNPRLEQIEYEELLPGWLNSLLKGGYKYFDVEELPENFKAVLKVHERQWILMLPVFKEEMLWGVLGIEFHRPHRPWQMEEIAILKAASSTIGGFVTSEEAKKQLRSAKMEADKANQAKSEFLAVISHELRTPMNAILGYSQLLHEVINDKDQKEQLGFIERSGRSLLDLINNILDFSKIESRGIDLEVIPFNFEQVIMEAIETCQIKAREKGITLDYTMENDFPKELLGDPHRLKQIVLNLINNAVKFTAQGGVSVQADFKRLPDTAKVLLHCGIRDSGIGIAPEKATRLFRAFSQVDSSTTRQYGGTGLGLAIAKRLVERMGGKIWVESAVGQGSVFHFTVQINEAAIMGHAARPEHHERQMELQKESIEVNAAEANDNLDPTFSMRFPLKILLVEDDPMNQKLILKILDRLGYNSVAVAFDGVEGLRRITEGDYQLVLSDLQMPKLDGLSMTRRVRMGECGASKKETPIVALTAYAMNEDRQRCMEAGMTEFLRKPIVMHELKEALITAYHKRLKGRL